MDRPADHAGVLQDATRHVETQRLRRGDDDQHIDRHLAKAVDVLDAGLVVDQRERVERQLGQRRAQRCAARQLQPDSPQKRARIGVRKPGGATLATLTIDIPDELSAQLDQVKDRLPELLALSLQQPAVPAHIYRAILDFLASKPTPDAIVAFRPAPEMQERLNTLLARSRAGQL